MNTWNLRIKIPAFIRNWKFETFDEMRHQYEKYVKQKFISQIPSLIKQKFIWLTNNAEIVEEDGNKSERKLKKYWQILFGEYSDKPASFDSK